MTGEQYIESIRKMNMEIYMFGEKVENPVDNPILRPSLNSVRMTYDLAQDPQYQDLMVVTSPFTGEKINVPVLGLVENMSWFTPAELPENKYYLFGKEGGKRLAEELNIPLLGQIPIVQSICEGGDSGKPVALNPDSITGQAFQKLAENVVKQIDYRNEHLDPTKRVVVTKK